MRKRQHASRIEISEVDGRTQIGQLIRRTRDQLLAQCPQPATPSDAALCEHAALLRGHLALLDQATFSGQATERQGRMFVSLSSAYMRATRQIAGRRSSRPTQHHPGEEALSAYLAGRRGAAA